MPNRASLLLASLHLSGRRLIASRSGATIVEYGLIVSAIAVLLIAAMQSLGSTIGGAFQGWADFFAN
jgi:Flp pilus assembly pilin Flp